MIKILTAKEALQHKKDTMISYLRMKMNEEDWHGVQDAASDLREIEVLLNEINNNNNESYASVIPKPPSDFPPNREIREGDRIGSGRLDQKDNTFKPT